MYTGRRYRKDPALMEEELFDGAALGRMATIRRVSPKF